MIRYFFRELWDRLKIPLVVTIGIVLGMILFAFLIVYSKYTFPVIVGFVLFLWLYNLLSEVWHDARAKYERDRNV